ncbi:MAG: A/G-specific adenine glycosylase [Pseudomonadota bacterium]
MPKSHAFQFKTVIFQENLLEWYTHNRRILPWRAAKGRKSDPYHVWLSEIMLQQTTVPAVIPYFLHFTQKWPTISDLALANPDDVMSSWAGLGYYARARNLLKCAGVINDKYDGKFPKEEAELMLLPGIGPYTAAAIRSIAFHKPAIVVDGNIERITARLFAIKMPFPEGKKCVRENAAMLFTGIENARKESVRDLPQALMDLGSTVCTPKSPKCSLCPISQLCLGFQQGRQADYPIKTKPKQIPTRTGRVYLIQTKDGLMALEKRDETRMLGGMLSFPTTHWDIKDDTQSHKHPHHFRKLKTLHKVGAISHTFSHFHLKLEVWHGIIAGNDLQLFNKLRQISFHPYENLEHIGLPTVFRKSLNIFKKYHNQE